MKSETSIKLFELTQEFIPDKKKAGLFVQKIEETVDDKMELRHENLATKTDLAELKVELVEVISNQKVELMEVISNQKVELMEVISNQKVELMEVISDQKAELKGEIAALQLEVRDQKVELMEVISDQKTELKGEIAALRSDLTKSIYFMGLVQFLAIMGGVLAIVTLMLK